MLPACQVHRHSLQWYRWPLTEAVCYSVRAQRQGIIVCATRHQSGDRSMYYITCCILSATWNERCDGVETIFTSRESRNVIQIHEIMVTRYYNIHYKSYHIDKMIRNICDGLEYKDVCGQKYICCQRIRLLIMIYHLKCRHKLRHSNDKTNHVCWVSGHRYSHMDRPNTTAINMAFSSEYKINRATFRRYVVALLASQENNSIIICQMYRA